MAWSRPSLTALIQRIEADLANQIGGATARLRTSVIAILAAVKAGAIHVLYGNLERWRADLNPSTAVGAGLDWLGEIWQLTREVQTYATGSVQFTGTNGTSIPSDTLLQAGDGTQIETTQAGIIADGKLVLAVQAVEPGTAGNLGGTGALTLVSPIAGVDDTATIEVSIDGGAEAETDASLRARIKHRIGHGQPVGAEADFERWCDEVNGIERAWVFPRDNMGTPTIGHVTIYLAATGDDPVPTAGEITAVETYLDTVGPAATQVHVNGVTSAAVVISVTLNNAPSGWETDLAAVLQAQALEALDLPAGTLRLTDIQGVFENTTASEVQVVSITVDGADVAIADVTFSGYVVPDVSFVEV